jgi:pterin-4a-carbinolamine dehydratase
MVTTTTDRYVPLTDEQVTGALRPLPHWRYDGSRLVRQMTPVDLWGLLSDVVALEEELDHHTVVDLDRGTVIFTVWTHVRNAVTMADVELADRLEALLALHSA